MGYGAKLKRGAEHGAKAGVDYGVEKRGVITFYRL